MIMLRPVFDPAIPVEVRGALLTHAEGLRPGSGAPPVPLGGRRRIGRDGVRGARPENGKIISQAAVPHDVGNGHLPGGDPMRTRPVNERRRMARPGSSRAHAALSRLPRWLAALGIVLLLGELAGAAALVAAGTHRGTGHNGRTRAVAGNHGKAAPHGRMRTVVLKVDGVLSPYAPKYDPESGCRPDCNLPPAPGTASYLFYSTPAGSRTYNYIPLPFTRTVQVPVGGSVTLDASPGSDNPVTCSILLNGRVLSRYTSDGSNNGMNCHATIPSGAPPTPAPRKRPTSAPRPGIRAVTLRVGGLSPGDTLDYETPAGSARDVHATALTFTKTLRVHSGGVVTIHAFTSKHDPVTCSIAANGRLLLQSSANQQGRDFCQARIP